MGTESGNVDSSGKTGLKQLGVGSMSNGGRTGTGLGDVNSVRYMNALGMQHASPLPACLGLSFVLICTLPIVTHAVGTLACT